MGAVSRRARGLRFSRRCLRRFEGSATACLRAAIPIITRNHPGFDPTKITIASHAMPPHRVNTPAINMMALIRSPSLGLFGVKDAPRIAADCRRQELAEWLLFEVSSQVICE
jgi:hypothetical protein